MVVDVGEGYTGKVHILCNENNVDSSLTKIHAEQDLVIYELHLLFEEAIYPEPVTLKWKIPAINVMGVWKPTSDFAKRIQADWELDHMESRISIDAPIISLFGHDDANVLTFACSNAVNKLEMNARLREEDNCFYCHITFFSESSYPVEQFKAQLRLDFREQHFSDSLKDSSKWWETFPDLKPTCVPPAARMPLYSTWYQFHQNLDLDSLLKECELAVDIGYKVIIIDDGWQTNDSNRGYDYTGDWKPERIPNMAGYVLKLHKVGMKVALWYSVPFCGKRSNAYKKFKGKFLTENHRWAPVFDPRFPEVREHLINLYSNALKDWKLDGFKLDFIDEFKLYPDTPVGNVNGRDYASINKAVDRLMTDLMKTLQAINSEVFIEFRQKYTGPAMRKYGNMFRAFDCPGDATMNRVRIADIRMLSGNTAVHSDMVTWHPDESVEIAALQMINTLFGVPQLSIMLHEAPAEHIKMISFFTAYWYKYSHILLEGDFTPMKPLANYPEKKSVKDNHIIIGVYDDYVVQIDEGYDYIHILNAKISKSITLNPTKDYGTYECIVQDCCGTIVFNGNIELNIGPLMLNAPPCGIIKMKKL